MTSNLGEKSLACLRMARFSFASQERQALYLAACERFSQKAVDKKFEDLVDAGYMECGVTARSGWLTEKGRGAIGISSDSTP